MRWLCREFRRKSRSHTKRSDTRTYQHNQPAQKFPRPKSRPLVQTHDADTDDQGPQPITGGQTDTARNATKTATDRHMARLRKAQQYLDTPAKNSILKKKPMHKPRHGKYPVQHLAFLILFNNTNSYNSYMS